ncbi:MAG: aminotransferase class V-fold PLP-dependent enzyme, partial [Phycisphaerae bacterium]|nr:aminotransferase class V-fold PLP-dependent enzyme [Phycisphaerae bacterium]
SPHKFHGPKGVGVLWLAPGFRVVPRVRGTQELGRRGGTENVPGIVGAGVAAEEARQWLADPARRQELAALRDRFEELVLAGVAGGVNGVVNSPRDPNGTPTDSARRLWNTTNIGFPRLEAEALLLLLSERGVAASAGAACSSGSLEPSPILLAMGIEPEIAHGSLRFSLGRDSTRQDVDQAAAIVVECVGVLARSGNVRR